MSSVFDLLPRAPQPRYGTGMWPLYYPRPWNLKAPPGVGVIIDPVAVASEVAGELRKIGWPGVELMDPDFQMDLLEGSEADIRTKVENWFENNRTAVANRMEKRFPTYGAARLSATSETAMKEAIGGYRSKNYLTVVRVLLPEFESIGRALVTDRVKKASQSQVIKDLQEALGKTPLIKEDPLESMSLFHFIDEHLFQKCFTHGDAANLGPAPNRHAELHGLNSYGTLQGASIVLCSTDLLLRFTGRLLDFGFTPPT